MSVNYVLISEITTTVSAASVTFSNLPTSGYTDLKIVVSARSTANGGQNMNLTFNSNTSGYSDRILSGNGSTASSFSSGNTARGGSCVMPGADFTANTYGNGEIYITNYRGSNPKLFMSDSVTENNATTSFNQMQTTQWDNSSAISTILIDLSGGSFVAGSTFSLYGIANFGTTPTVLPKASGGDIVVNDGTYWYHAFLSSGIFAPSSNLSCDVLVVAGGGAGGAGHAGGAGGGGAGGLLGFTSQSLTSGTSYACTVGAGGAARSSVNGGAVFVGNNGSNSVFQGLTAAVGGGGGAATATSPSNIQGNTGGSGGGTAFWNASTLVAGGQGTTNQGYSAGQVQGPGYTRAASGGGGAGASSGDVGAANGYDSTAGGIGATFNTSVGGTAGPYSFINGMASATSTGVLSSGNYYYAGGGGAGGAGTAKAGGIGGGGAGYGTSVTGTATSGTVNTGGGGGGASADASGIYTFTSGSGGSGIIIVRYTMA